MRESLVKVRDEEKEEEDEQVKVWVGEIPRRGGWTLFVLLRVSG